MPKQKTISNSNSVSILGIPFTFSRHNAKCTIRHPRHQLSASPIFTVTFGGTTETLVTSPAGCITRKTDHHLLNNLDNTLLSLSGVIKFNSLKGDTMTIFTDRSSLLNPGPTADSAVVCFDGLQNNHLLLKQSVGSSINNYVGEFVGLPLPMGFFTNIQHKKEWEKACIFKERLTGFYMYMPYLLQWYMKRIWDSHCRMEINEKLAELQQDGK